MISDTKQLFFVTLKKYYYKNTGLTIEDYLIISICSWGSKDLLNGIFFKFHHPNSSSIIPIQSKYFEFTHLTIISWYFALLDNELRGQGTSIRMLFCLEAENNPKQHELKRHRPLLSAPRRHYKGTFHCYSYLYPAGTTHRGKKCIIPRCLLI